MLKKLYAQWMYGWETRLTMRDENRVVRPLEWGFDWLRPFLEETGMAARVARMEAAGHGEAAMVEVNEAILAGSDLLALSLIDWDTGFIPDALSFALIAGGLLCAPISPLLTRSSWYWSVAASALGAAVGFLICWGTAELGKRVFGKEAMGWGDVILLAGVGAWTGGTGAYDCLLVGSLLGSIYGVGRVLRGDLRMGDPVPFGPFLAAGAVFNFFCLLPLGFPFTPIR